MVNFINLVEEDEEPSRTPLSPRTKAFNTLASLPQSMRDNPAEACNKIYCQYSNYIAVSIAKLAKEKCIRFFCKQKNACADRCDEGLVIEAPGLNERIFYSRSVDSHEPHFFLLVQTYVQRTWN